MKKLTKDELLKKANGWAWEAQWAASTWRAESWRDYEMYDGGESAWTATDLARFEDAGVDPVHINRTFPTLNMLLGSQIVNRFEMIAKARTQQDGQISQVMSEGIKFIMDQADGEYLITTAFANAVIPGIGCLSPGLNEDPRKETLTIKLRDWKEIWWDPFSPPWWTPTKTRFVMWQRWADLDDIKAIFHEKRKQIDDAYNEISGANREHGYSALMDEAQHVEEHIRSLSASEWIDTERKRIRPIEMWYPVNELCMFALYPDGRCYEIRKDMDELEAFQAIQGSQQVLRSIVKKMRVMTFFGEHLILQDEPSPYNHDQYPLIPFVGYLDRYGFPYGVPRQIRGQDEEVSKRRSMALAMLQKRRVIAEKSVVPNGDKDALDTLHEEANKIDGFMVVEDGKLGAFQLEDLAALAAPQVDLMRQSEIEIKEIAGTNSEALGHSTRSDQSGKAKTIDIQRSQVNTATLFDNLRRSMGLLGNQTMCNMQQFWKYEKVLRVTDRLTGAERFVNVNQPVQGVQGVTLKNNITQGKFDTVVSEAPATDTVREKNMDLLYAAIEKCPPEAVPTLLIAAFEVSELPNKDLLIEKLKPVLGINPEDESEDPEETKQRILQELQAQKEQAKVQAQLQQEAARLELNEKRLTNVKMEAEIAKIAAETEKIATETDIAEEEHDLNVEDQQIGAFERGVDVNQKLAGKERANTPA